MILESARRAVPGAICLLLIAAIPAAAADLRLVEAAKRRDSDAVRRLIKEGADARTPQPDGATALHWAAHWDDVAMADLLIAAGADVNAAEDGGTVPLNLACMNRNAAMVERLLKAGADPNSGRESAVMTAARTGSAAVMKLLLAAGGNVNAKERVRGQTALMWAASEKHHEVMQLLIAHGADVHARTLVPPQRQQRSAAAAAAGISADAGLSNGFTPLLFAVRVGDREAVRLLLAAGAKVNDAAADGMSPLVLAAVRGFPALATDLLDKGADPNANGAGYTALHWAAGSWETELTVTSITIDRDGEWATVAGLRDGRLDLVNALLAHGADPNARIRRAPARVGSSKNPALAELEGATPFLVAAVAGATDIMRVLVKHGANPRLRTVRNGTPLMAAAGLGRVIGEVLVPEDATLAAAKYILELGDADIDTVDAVGNTALHYAAYLRRDSIVELLASHGANLEIPNVFGETPLWLAECVIQYAGGGRYEVGPSTTGAVLRKLGAKPIKPPYILRFRYWPDQQHV